MPPHASRLRRRLLALVLAVSLPLVVLAVLNAGAHQRADREYARANALRLARLVAAQQEQVLAGSEHLLVALAGLPEIRARDPHGCRERLREVVRRFPQYANLGVISTDGRAWCNALVSPEELPRANPDLMSAVRRAVEHRAFAVGGFGIGTISRRTVVLAAFPLVDADNGVTAAVAASIDLRWLGALAKGARLPRDAAVLLVDSSGTVLAQMPETPARMGRSIAGTPLFRAVSAAPNWVEGVTEVEGLDGASWLTAHVRLDGPPGATRPVLLVAQPTASAYAQAARSQWREIGLLAAVIASALAAAWLIGGAFVARRVAPLVAATRRVADGDTTPHPIPVSETDEMGELARAFERMTASLHGREEEAQRSADALRRSEERYRAVVRASSQIVWSMDSAGRPTGDMLEWRALTGQTPERMAGFGWLNAIHPEDRPRVRDAARRMYATGVGEELEFRVRAASGGWRRCRSFTTAVHESDGTVREFVGVLEDITERRAAEEALRRVEEQYRQAQKMEAVGRLAGGVAHDFNNLLAAITSYAQLLAADPTLGPAPREDVQEIRKAANRAAGLVRQLLAVSRRQTVSLGPVDLNAVVRDLERMLGRLLGPDVHLVTALAPELGAALADLAQLEQALLNLVTNARDAMPTGGRIVVETASATLDHESAGRLGVTPGEYVTLTVRDEGTGMEDGVRSRMFEPFFTTKGRGKGTGLGLATVYAATVQHGGAVEVDTTLGAGTTVRLLFRRAAERADASADAHEAEGDVPGRMLAERERPVPRATERARGTVLLVDDEAPVRQATARLLRQNGFTVRDAASGEAALQLLQQDPAGVDVLCTDVVMPRMSGVELAHRARALRPELPLVLLSGYAADTISSRQPLPAGATLLAKPVDLGELLGTLASRVPAHPVDAPDEAR